MKGVALRVFCGRRRVEVTRLALARPLAGLAEDFGLHATSSASTQSKPLIRFTKRYSYFHGFPVKSPGRIWFVRALGPAVAGAASYNRKLPC
jgi:hypothetical protein